MGDRRRRLQGELRPDRLPRLLTDRSRTRPRQGVQEQSSRDSRSHCVASGSRPIVKVRSAESEPRLTIFPCGMFGLVRGSVACVACGMRPAAAPTSSECWPSSTLPSFLDQQGWTSPEVSWLRVPRTADSWRPVGAHGPGNLGAVVAVAPVLEDTVHLDRHGLGPQCVTNSAPTVNARSPSASWSSRQPCWPSRRHPT